MEISELRWSKVKVQCPHCGIWLTRQGINGHIRFRHPEGKSDDKQKMLGRVGARALAELAIRDIAEQGHLSPEVRQLLMDDMLLDHLRKKVS